MTKHKRGPDLTRTCVNCNEAMGDVGFAVGKCEGPQTLGYEPLWQAEADHLKALVERDRWLAELQECRDALHDLLDAAMGMVADGHRTACHALAGPARFGPCDCGYADLEAAIAKTVGGDKQTDHQGGHMEPNGWGQPPCAHTVEADEDRDAAIARAEKESHLASRWEQACLAAQEGQRKALAQRDEALVHFKDVLGRLFSSCPPWKRARRYFAWAKRAAHPGMAWPTAAETEEMLKSGPTNGDPDPAAALLARAQAAEDARDRLYAACEVVAKLLESVSQDPTS